MSNPPPTLYDWAGGAAGLQKLFTRFYERVPADPLLAPIFAKMDPAHAVHVAAFVGEVFGGPRVYSQEHGGHPHMIHKHLDRALDNDKRKRWIALCSTAPTRSGSPTIRSFARRSLRTSSGDPASPSSTRSRARKRSRTRRCRRGAGVRSRARISPELQRDAQSTSAPAVRFAMTPVIAPA